MTETVWLALILAAALVLIFFRDNLKKFVLRIRGVDASMETRDRPSVSISGNVQNGKKHQIKTGGQRDVSISDNLQEGEENLIDAGSSSEKGKQA